MRTIRITGKGVLKLKPDTTRLTLTVGGVAKEYADALAESTRATELLRETFSAFGFGNSDLKTLSFDVNAEYEGYEEKGVWKQRFAGYRSRHTMKLEFPIDRERLHKVALLEDRVRKLIELTNMLFENDRAGEIERLTKLVQDRHPSL